MLIRSTDVNLFLTKSIAFYLGCLSCYSLQVEGHLSSVAAAALTGFVGSFLHFPKFFEKKNLHAAIYAGAFAGMCSRTILANHNDIMIISLIGAFLFVVSRSLGNGFGGRLGTIAFVASIVFSVLRSFL